MNDTLFTFDQKQRRENVSNKYLELFQYNSKEFLRRFVTADETWFYHYTPETKQQSKQ